ncbi:MAG: hypothetical protein LBR80_11255 [Deltaproteobacteria bacterium]|jgi:hypothetical protein|nr:hypothetical protein [Deltaproteobacteria bacterium]
MSDELTAFLNFSFQNNQVATKVLDDSTRRITSAVRWQLNWTDYSRWLSENGVCTAPELRPSLARYGAPQPNELLYEDLLAFQAEMRRTAREIIVSRRVSPELWRSIVKETEGFASVLSGGTGIEGEITPENVGSLKLRYTYDTPAYRGAIMAVLRDLITSGDIFRLREDENGVFSLSPAVGEKGPDNPPPWKREAIPLKEALSRASRKPSSPAQHDPMAEAQEPPPKPPVTFSLMSELSDEDIMAALADPFDNDEPLALTEKAAAEDEPVALTDLAGEVESESLAETAEEAPVALTDLATEEPVALAEEPDDLGDDQVELAYHGADDDKPDDHADQTSDENEPVLLADQAADEEEPVLLAGQSADEDEPVLLADQAADEDEPVPLADQTAGEEEPVLLADQSAGEDESVTLAARASEGEPLEISEDSGTEDKPVPLADISGREPSAPLGRTVPGEEPLALSEKAVSEDEPSALIGQAHEGEPLDPEEMSDAGDREGPNAPAGSAASEGDRLTSYGIADHDEALATSASQDLGARPETKGASTVGGKDEDSATHMTPAETQDRISEANEETVIGSGVDDADGRLQAVVATVQAVADAEDGVIVLGARVNEAEYDLETSEDSPLAGAENGVIVLGARVDEAESDMEASEASPLANAEDGVIVLGARVDEATAGLEPAEARGLAETDDGAIVLDARIGEAESDLETREASPLADADDGVIVLDTRVGEADLEAREASPLADAEDGVIVLAARVDEAESDLEPRGASLQAEAERGAIVLGTGLDEAEDGHAFAGMPEDADIAYAPGSSSAPEERPKVLLDGHELFDLRSRLTDPATSPAPAPPRKNDKRDLFNLESDAVQKQIEAEETNEPFLDSEALEAAAHGLDYREEPMTEGAQSEEKHPASGSAYDGGEITEDYEGYNAGDEGYAIADEGDFHGNLADVPEDEDGRRYPEGPQAASEEEIYEDEDEYENEQASASFLPVEFLLGTLEQRARLRQGPPNNTYLN